MTGFGKLFIFLLIVAPIAYFGAQYLRNSGALDKMKEKVERTKDDRQEKIEAETGNDILDEINNKANREPDKEKEAIIAEQQRKIEELERQNQDLRNRSEAKPSTSNLPPLSGPDKPQPNTNQNDAPSLDDLIRQAEIGLNGKETSSDLGSSKKSLALWSFAFSNVSGTIELYEQDDRLMSRTVYQGTSKVDVSELIYQDDKLFVRNSPTGEYYILRSDGNLDAYDKDGFQTTCRRN